MLAAQKTSITNYRRTLHFLKPYGNEQEIFVLAEPSTKM